MKIPHWPHHEQDEIDAVAAVLETGQTNQWTGSTVGKFEQAFADQFSLSHALAVANGTVALELALRGLGIGPDDDVLVSSRSFVASASMPLMLGARPVFADVELPSGNVTVETLEAARTPSTRCAIVVHLCGWPCDMPSIMSWASEHNILIIEDCAQAHGAAIAGRSVGSFGHAAAFSFCQDKILSTGGEGGMLGFRDQHAYERAWTWRDHGKLRQESIDQSNVPTTFRWLAAELGTNLRMTGMQAAIGLVQLKKLDVWRSQRESNAQSIAKAFCSCDIIDFPWPESNLTHAWYQATCILKDQVDRDSLLTTLRAEGWPIRSGTCPELYRERVFDKYQPDQLMKGAAAIGRSSLILPVHPTCSADDMVQMSNAVLQAINLKD